MIPDAGMENIGGMDGDAEERVVGKGLGEKAVPEDADAAAPAAAYAPAEGLGAVATAGGEIED